MATSTADLERTTDLLGVVPYVGAAAKGALGLYQLFSDVGRTDTTTAQDRERLAIARQSAAGRLPGLASYQARLAQGQNAAQQSAALGSGSASDFLAASAAANRVREQGETQLGIQDQQYRDRSTQQLSSVLAQMSERSRADTERAAQANSTLKGAAVNNLANGANEAATVAAYQGASAANKNGLGNFSAKEALPTGDYPSAPYGQPDYLPDPYNTYRRRRPYSNAYSGYPS